jgi:RES domain
MSPAGSVMMYASEDASTALHETANSLGTYAIGEFRTRRVLRILDLAELPPVPSRFEEIPDSLAYDPRRNLIFLHRLARDISRPIARDDRIHVDYVPTQVVTEYLRSGSFPDGQLDGIRYRSSRRTDGISVVLFADKTNVVGARTDGHFGRKSDEWLQQPRRPSRS